MSTQTGVFVRVTRFQTHSFSCTFLEIEPDGFETAECAAESSFKLASLGAGGNATNEILLY